MVERRKGSAVAIRQSPRSKRRRLNPGGEPSTKPIGTPTRTSSRLARKTSHSQKNFSRIKWETELPNATAALDLALSKIASRGTVETRDLCDEISDYLTQALFEDVWRCENSRDFPQESNTREAVGTASKSGEKEQTPDRENIEPNVTDTDMLKHALPPANSDPVPEIIAVDSDTPSLSISRRTSEKRRRENPARKSQPREIRQEGKKRIGKDKTEVLKSKTRKRIPPQRVKLSDDGFAAFQFRDCNGGLVEEVIEIEEDFVDGGVASILDPNKTLLGDVEEQVLDRSGSKSAPNSKMKNATPSTGMSRRKSRNKKLLGDVEEQVLDRSGSTSVPGSDEKLATPRERMSRRLPWWCVADDILAVISKSEKEVLRSYVTAIIRTCVRESWNAETLKEGYGRDPNSNRGQAFRAVHEALQLLERARHMKECEARWRPELLRELLQRQEVDWSMVKHDKKFDQFAGCDACLGHRRATARIWLKGKRYDASDFWPGTSRFHVLSAKQVNDRKLSVSAELRNGTTNDHLIRIGANENDTEFWVDSHCLRKCLLFHELVHSTATIARDCRRIIERELGNGTIELKLSSKESNGNAVSVSERLERYLLRSVLHDKEYVRNHVDHLTDIIRLGDVYFSSPDAEVLDSGKPGKSVYVPSIYDAPLDLGDEEFKQRIDDVVGRSRRKRQSKYSSA